MPRRKKRTRRSSKKKKIPYAIRKYEVLHLYNIPFKDNRDHTECVQLHFLLQQCELVQKYMTDQNIIKEIALFAMGLCINYISCKTELGIMYKDVLSIKRI